MSDSDDSDIELFTTKPRPNQGFVSSDDDSNEDDALFMRKPPVGKRKSRSQNDQSEREAGAPASVAEAKAARRNTEAGLFDDAWDESPLDLLPAEPSKKSTVVNDQATSEILRRNKEAVENLRKEQASIVHEDDDDEEVVEIEDNDEEPSKAEPLNVVLRTQEWQDQFSIAKNAPVSELMVTFRTTVKGKQIEVSLGRKPRFFFDGDALKDHDTPEGLDMEDGDVIDVR